jgi:LacI family transcriptional regulator
VAPITVSRVVNKYPHVRRATREKVLRAIAELKYIPNAAARGLKRSRSELIALIITDISSPFYTAVARGAEDAARAAGLSLILGNSDEEPLVEAEYLRVMGERRVDGVILSPTTQAAEALARNLPVGLPVVLFDRIIPGIDTDLVRCNTQDGVRRLTHHLLSLGHRRIVIVGGMPTVSTWPERVTGYQTALRDAGLIIDDSCIIPGDYRQESGVEAVRTLLAGDPAPDAIIAANAQVALGVLDELTRHGLRVPEDMAVAAVDDPLPNVPFFPRLTVVEQPGYQMGKAALELLVARLRGTRGEEEPWKLVFDAGLRVGVSCGEQQGDLFSGGRRPHQMV